MTELYVALAAVLASAVTAIVFGNLLRIVIRQHARERERLVNQVCHLSGRPGQEAPVNEREWPTESPRLLVAAPEQYPDS